MRVIFSRKGFDSSAGGFPSPAVDGTLISIPIPAGRGDPGSLYRQLRTPLGISYAELMNDLEPTRGAIGWGGVAHFDPQVDPKPNWLGALGHSGSAQKHALEPVVPGDIFLFFGWFRQAEETAEGYRWKPHAKDFHAIWSYLQVGEVLDVDDNPDVHRRFGWHPHVQRNLAGGSKGDRLWVAARELNFEGLGGRASGLLRLTDTTRLTVPGGEERSEWQLPLGFDPRDNPISGLGELIGGKERYRRERDHLIVNSGGRGQEFVATVTPDVQSWLKELLSSRV
jgi:hypothetical protein